MNIWIITDPWLVLAPYYGASIALLTPEQLREREPESLVVCIDGTACKVKDCDYDVRGGLTAYGDVLVNRPVTTRLGEGSA